MPNEPRIPVYLSRAKDISGAYREEKPKKHQQCILASYYYVNLWSNNKKLMTNNERLVNYGACDLIMLSKQSP
jgi:hypothetical protein